MNIRKNSCIAHNYSPTELLYEQAYFNQPGTAVAAEGGSYHLQYTHSKGDRNDEGYIINIT